MTSPFPEPVSIGIAMVFALLALGSCVRIASAVRLPVEVRRTRLGSLLVWWIGLILVVALAAVGWPGIVVAFGLLAWLGLEEYFRLLDALGFDRAGRWITRASMVATYWGFAWSSHWTAGALLIAVSFGISLRLIWLGRTKGYLASVGSLVWGWVLLALLLPHAFLLFQLPTALNTVGGGAGWFLYLIVMTELDDIFQALWGRRFGRTPITPRVSPHKTLEGLLGGIGTTVLASLLLAPWLTPLSLPISVRIGDSTWVVPYVGSIFGPLVICGAGFLGDLNMSAIKRDAGVKDTGSFLPGQGGLLDRIDSLIFTAPAFYYFVQWVYG